MLIATVAFAAAQAGTEFRLEDIDLKSFQQDWSFAKRDKSVDGKPLKVGGVTYPAGVGTHATSKFKIKLDGAAVKFVGLAGPDEEVLPNKATIEFVIAVDGKTVWKSGVMKSGDVAKAFDVPLKGAKTMTLSVTDGGDDINYDHADWLDCRIVMASGKPVAMTVPAEAPYIWTPKPGPKPRLTGAKIYGARPGHEFIYRLTATGEGPMKFAAAGLPKGLNLDPATGVIRGTVKDRGTYTVKVSAKNGKGSASRDFTIKIGDRIALTPPLGWNSWNCFAGDVDQKKMEATADMFVKSGLINHGWTYINIDDCWEIQPGSRNPLTSGIARDENGMINTNAKFPDMKRLVDKIHSLGLKAGLYSSPGPYTCAGFTGSYQFEKQDAKRWAEWGFDYVKYDWCSYGSIAKDNGLFELKKPYAVMNEALKSVDRDILFSLCQYGMGDVWKWGDEVGGNCWRTTGDITDTWRSMSSIGFSQAGHEAYAKPGNWNDPDMLVVGWVGWGPALHPTKLTPSEQYTHITLWSLLNSPLLIGCDLTRLDDFTKNLLTNDEVLEVNQDPLGVQASRISMVGETQVWAKRMEDGSFAVGLFNLNEEEGTVTMKLSELGLTGSCRVRDVWKQKDIGTVTGSYSAKVKPHGAIMIRVWEKS